MAKKTKSTKSEADEGEVLLREKLAEHTPAPTEPADVVPAGTDGQGEPSDPPALGSHNIEAFIEQQTEIALAETGLIEVTPFAATPISNTPASIIPASIPPQPLAAKGYNNVLIEGFGILVLNDASGTANYLTRGIPQVVSDLVLSALEMEVTREKFRKI